MILYAQSNVCAMRTVQANKPRLEPVLSQPKFKQIYCISQMKAYCSENRTLTFHNQKTLQIHFHSLDLLPYVSLWVHSFYSPYLSKIWNLHISLIVTMKNCDLFFSNLCCTMFLPGATSSLAVKH